jgi:hypothetical protein
MSSTTAYFQFSPSDVLLNLTAHQYNHLTVNRQPLELTFDGDNFLVRTIRPNTQVLVEDVDDSVDDFLSEQDGQSSSNFSMKSTSRRVARSFSFYTLARTLESFSMTMKNGLQNARLKHSLTGADVHLSDEIFDARVLDIIRSRGIGKVNSQIQSWQPASHEGVDIRIKSASDFPSWWTMSTAMQKFSLLIADKRNKELGLEDFVDFEEKLMGVPSNLPFLG